MPVLQRVSISIKNILVATDFSSVSKTAAAYAKGLALNYRSQLELVHVFDPGSIKDYADTLLGLETKERLRLSTESLAEMQHEFAAAGIPTQTVIPEDHKPHTALLRLARKNDADLIVAGTHSKWGLERLVLGSTAEQLIRNATCPVLTVGPNAQQPQDGPLVFRRIIYATDFSAHAAKAAIFALSFAQDSGAHIYLCHIAKADESNQEAVSHDAEFNAALTKLIPESVYEWCSPETVVRHGQPAKAILDLAHKVHADLIVLGARNSSFWLTHVEHGLTPDLLAEARCPVMTVC
jgi:nucleotide-binding universal stress UspA family protein